MPDPKTITPVSFCAVNSTIDAEPTPKANDNKVTVIYTVIITIIEEGEEREYKSTYKSNELPVCRGDKVEVAAEFDNNSGSDFVLFAMPDGVQHVVTKSAPSCVWTVPNDFTQQGRITAQWVDASGEVLYDLISYITIVPLDN